MGLDITAYTRLVATDETPNDVGDYDWKTRFWSGDLSWTEENWPGRSAGVESETMYVYAESFDFRAGSYSGYNAWRSQLAQVMLGKSVERAWHEDTAGPFFELIHFADNEGVIGPVVAAKLAKDFDTHLVRAQQVATAGDEYFLVKYEEWRKAFHMAADNGAVDFH